MPKSTMHRYCFIIGMYNVDEFDTSLDYETKGIYFIVKLPQFVLWVVSVYLW